jgi:hypothetical protein
MLSSVKVGDWLVVIPAFGRTKDFLFAQVVEVTDTLVKTSRYKFRFDGKRWPNQSPKLTARPALAHEVEKHLAKK